VTAPYPRALQGAQHLGRRLAELTEAIETLHQAELNAVTARHEARLREWKTFLATEGAMELRKIRARHDAAELMFAADVAEVTARNCAEIVREKRQRVDVGRTYSADMRAEAQVVGRYGPGDGTP